MKDFKPQEANSLVRLCFRNNTVLEDVHAGVRILDDKTMKELMKQCTNNLLTLLAMKEKSPKEYYACVLSPVGLAPDWDLPEVDEGFREALIGLICLFVDDANAESRKVGL